MDLQPLISIIIPTYNRYDFIGETLDSVLSQTYENWECIIIDDGSTDYTDEIISFYIKLDRRIKLYYRPLSLPKGPSACRNYGFKMSNGEYVNWFDSDDLMHPNFLLKKLQRLIRTKGYCCVSNTQYFSIVQGEKIISSTSRIQYNNILEDLIHEKIGIGTTNPLWEKSFLKSFNLFDETLKHSEDLEFHSRIFHRYDEIEVIDEVLINIRTGHSSISNDFYKQFPKSLDSFLMARRKIIIHTSDNLRINKIIIRQLLSLLRYLLCKKKYKDTDKIIKFIGEYSKDSSLKYRLRFIRLFLSYQIFKLIGRGETRFKKNLYLP